MVLSCDKMWVQNNFLFIVFSLFLFVHVNAQHLDAKKIKDTTSIGSLLKHDAKNALFGVTHAISRPFHWRKKDFSTIGIIAAGSLALSTLDDEGSAFFIRQEPKVPSFFQEFGTRFGSPQVYFIANAGLYGFGLLTKNEKIRKTSVLIISSSFTSGIIQTISKTGFGRARPGNGNLKSTDFKFWSSEPKLHSFPSGHTVLSVTMAHAIAKQFENTWSKVAVYTIGSIAPISRLFSGAHWLTDVALGTVLSIVVVDSIDKFLFQNKAYNDYRDKRNLTWNFMFGGNKIGLVGVF